MGAPKCEHGDMDRRDNGRCRICTRASALRYANSEHGRSQARAYFQATHVFVGESKNGRKTHCPSSHAYTSENTYLHAQSSGSKGVQRRCKTCRRAQVLRYFHDKRANGGTHTETEWLALCARYDQRCASCGGSKKLTRDHIVPVSKGGTNDIDNIQPLCKSCNSAKKDKVLQSSILPSQKPDCTYA